jgi:hypothetical protein
MNGPSQYPEMTGLPRKINRQYGPARAEDNLSRQAAQPRLAHAGQFPPNVLQGPAAAGFRFG